MVKIYKLGTKEQTTLKFDTVIQVEKYKHNLKELYSKELLN